MSPTGIRNWRGRGVFPSKPHRPDESSNERKLSGARRDGPGINQGPEKWGVGLRSRRRRSVGNRSVYSKTLPHQSWSPIYTPRLAVHLGARYRGNVRFLIGVMN